jgi:transposase-like protein
MAERGLRVDHSTIGRWVPRCAPELSKSFRREIRLRNRSWRVDEIYVRVAGRWTYLYRAVDSMLSPKRDAVAAKHFLQLALGRTQHGGAGGCPGNCAKTRRSKKRKTALKRSGLSPKTYAFG